MSRVKTRSYPSTSAPPARCKRNLEDESTADEPMEDGGSTKIIDNACDVAMETEGSNQKRQQTDKKGIYCIM